MPLSQYCERDQYLAFNQREKWAVKFRLAYLDGG